MSNNQELSMSNEFSKPSYETLRNRKSVLDSLRYTEQLIIKGSRSSDVLIISPVIVADTNNFMVTLDLSDDKVAENNLYLSTHSDALANWLNEEHGVHAIIEHIPFVSNEDQQEPKDSPYKTVNERNLSIERIMSDPKIVKFIKDNNVKTVIRFFKRPMEEGKSFHIVEMFGKNATYDQSPQVTELLKEFREDKLEYTYKAMELDYNDADMPKVVTLALPVVSHEVDRDLTHKNNLAIYRAVGRAIRRLHTIREQEKSAEIEKARQKVK